MNSTQVSETKNRHWVTFMGTRKTAIYGIRTIIWRKIPIYEGAALRLLDKSRKKTTI